MMVGDAAVIHLPYTSAEKFRDPRKSVGVDQPRPVVRYTLALDWKRPGAHGLTFDFFSAGELSITPFEGSRHPLRQTRQPIRI